MESGISGGQSKPLVSIIVRTKDRPKLLRRAVQSIAAQTYRPIEVVLVNDGGCDLDLSELESALGDVSLNYTNLEKNLGRSQAGNIGIETATGSYLGLLDDDDILYANHVETLVGFLCNSDVKVAYTDAYIVKEVPSKEGYRVVSKETGYRRDFNSDRLLFENYIPLMCVMARSELLRKELFDTSFDLFEDWDLMIRLAQHTSFHRIPEVTAEYRMREDNTMTTFGPHTSAHIEARYSIYRKHAALLREHSISIFDSLFLESERHRHLYEAKTEEFRKYVETRDREFADAKKYISEKEEELLRVQAFIKERDGELSKAKAFIREKENELFSIRDYLLVKEKELADVRQSIIAREAEIERKKEGMVSVVILTYNGEKYLQNLLEAIFYQEVERPLEVIVIDSSSEDATRDIVENHKSVGLHVIDKTEFSHPKTRNMGASLAKGAYVVFVTQDALPANKFWLKELLKPFGTIENLAASYSRQIPRPECNPLEAKDIYTGAPCVDELRYAELATEWQSNDYASNIHRFIRFSNVSACYRADLLKANLFDECLTMVEDQEWSKRMIEQGYAIYYAAKSLVIHSHNLSTKEIYNRFFDYGSSFRRFLAHSAPKRTSSVKATFYDFVNDILFILNDGRRFRSKVKWICLSPVMRFAANYGLYKGWRNG